MERPAGQDLRHGQEEAHSNTEVGGQKINASEANPRYLVESEKSGREAAHKPGALSKV
ncbi:MAG TPA: DUF2945 domain-containing protein [Rubrobacter sp.]|nr:DUF2945 domain-containing protein [Rubrobacter sp.]